MTTTILQGNRVFEVVSEFTPAVAPTLLDNNKNVWSNVVINCDCTTSKLNIALPSLASLGNTFDCEIIISKTDNGINQIFIDAFTDGLGYDNFIGSLTSVTVDTQWSSAILRPASSNSWAIEFSA